MSYFWVRYDGQWITPFSAMTISGLLIDYVIYSCPFHVSTGDILFYLCLAKLSSQENGCCIRCWSTSIHLLICFCSFHLLILFMNSLFLCWGIYRMIMFVITFPTASGCDDSHEFQCGGHHPKCISRLLVCDSYPDCENNADENEQCSK